MAYQATPEENAKLKEFLESQFPLMTWSGATDEDILFPDYFDPDVQRSCLAQWRQANPIPEESLFFVSDYVSDSPTPMSAKDVAEQ